MSDRAIITIGFVGAGNWAIRRAHQSHSAYPQNLSQQSDRHSQAEGPQPLAVSACSLPGGGELPRDRQSAKKLLEM